SGAVPPPLHASRHARQRRHVSGRTRRARHPSLGRLNLIEESYPMAEYDAVFCRNVLIYFTASLRAAVVRRLISHVSPGGYFFVGHAESLAGVTEAVRPVVPTVYVR